MGRRVDEEALEELERYSSKTPAAPDTLPLPSDVTKATSDVDDTIDLDAILEELDPVATYVGTTPVDDVDTVIGDSLPVTSSPLVRAGLSGKHRGVRRLFSNGGQKFKISTRYLYTYQNVYE